MASEGDIGGSSPVDHLLIDSFGSLIVDGMYDVCMDVCMYVDEICFLGLANRFSYPPPVPVRSKWLVCPVQVSYPPPVPVRSKWLVGSVQAVGRFGPSSWIVCGAAAPALCVPLHHALAADARAGWFSGLLVPRGDVIDQRCHMASAARRQLLKYTISSVKLPIRGVSGARTVTWWF